MDVPIQTSIFQADSPIFRVDFSKPLMDSRSVGSMFRRPFGQETENQQLTVTRSGPAAFVVCWRNEFLGRCIYG